MNKATEAERIIRAAWEAAEREKDPLMDRRTAVVLVSREEAIKYLQAVKMRMRYSPQAIIGDSLGRESRSLQGDKDILAARRAIKRMERNAYASDAEGMIQVEIAGKDIAALGRFSVGRVPDAPAADFFLDLRKAYINEPRKTEPRARFAAVRNLLHRTRK